MAEMGMKQDSVEYQKQQDAVNRDLSLMQYYTNIDQANMRDELGFQRDLSKMDLQQKYGVQNDIRNFEQQKILAKMWYNNQAYLQNLQFGQQTALQNQKDYQDRLKILTDQWVPYNDAVAQLSGQTGQSKDMYVADFIKGKEWFRDKAYDDFDGHILAPWETPKGTATIWYGTTQIDGKPITWGQTITREQADAEFAKQVGRYQNFKNLVNVQLSPQQEAALTSFEYNLGSGIWNKKTGGAQWVIDAINSGDFQKAGDLMKQFNKAGGQVVQGLVNRRNDEANMMLQSSPTQTAQNKNYTTTDIQTFNNLTPSDAKKMQNNPKFIAMVEDKSKVMEDPNANIYDILKYSKWGKDLWDSATTSLAKFWQALAQVWDLQKSISSETTWPILWTLRQYNPYDSNAQAFKAQINSLIPNLARGVYSEVGVLTDQDIENYAKTVPNLKSTADTNKLVMAMTLKAIQNGFKSQIQTQASAWRDVSLFAGDIKRYDAKINELLNWTGVSVSGGNVVNTKVYNDAAARLEALKASRNK